MLIVFVFCLNKISFKFNLFKMADELICIKGGNLICVILLGRFKIERQQQWNKINLKTMPLI